MSNDLTISIIRNSPLSHFNFKLIYFGKMSILEKIKLHLTIIGVKPAANRNLPSFLQHFGAVINIMHVSFVIFTFLTLNISSLWFLISEAVSFTQYSEAVLFYMVTYLHLSFYIISILKRDSILSFIDDLERVIQTSENERQLIDQGFGNIK